MDFDVFDKLSELETKVYVLEAELEEKNATINSLMARIKELENASHNSTLATDLNFSLENGKSIADVLKETSESALQCTGYIFDERSGLYFDENSGYYYDPKNQLFYEPKSGTYYRYNTETGEYIHKVSVDKKLAAQFEHVTNQIRQSGKLREVRRNSPNDRTKDLSRRPSPNRRRRRSRSHDGSQSAPRHRGPHSRSTSHSPSPVRRSRKIRSHGHKRSRNMSRSPVEEKVRRARSWGKRRRRCRSTDGSNSPCKSDRSDSSDRPDVRSQSASLIAKPVVYPPVVRLMLLASQHAMVGTVFIITSEESSKGWACIGSSSAMCPSIHFPGDPTLDPIHCEIIYDEDDQRYALMDRDSESGTYLNGRILAKRAQIILHHGDVIRVGTSRLLVHIHEGHDSCGQCDPEVVRLAMEAAQVPTVPGPMDAEHGSTNEVTDAVAKAEEEQEEDRLLAAIPAAEMRELERRVTLDQLKEKYGLKHRVPVPKPIKPNYHDRAAQRRAIESNLKACGYVSPERAKRIPLIQRAIPTVAAPQPGASVPLAAENRGAKLLSKMGWNPGQGLGKDNRGIAEPICVTRRVNPLAGLGSSETAAHGVHSVPLDATPRELQNARVRAITRERYERAA